ncbi:MAG: AtpZ/AtpI family protein [Planctomycetota bacterium]
MSGAPLDGEPGGERPAGERPGGERLSDRVARYRSREQRARHESEGSFWRTLGQVGALGWLIALPTALGAFLGHLLDKRMGTGVTWALGLLALGLGAGLYSLWRAMGTVRAEEEALAAALARREQEEREREQQAGEHAAAGPEERAP